MKIETFGVKESADEPADNHGTGVYIECRCNHRARSTRNRGDSLERNPGSVSLSFSFFGKREARC